MPAASYPSNAPCPRAELIDITSTWVARAAEVNGRVNVPVFHRQAEFDHLWNTNQDEIDKYRATFTSAPSIDTALEPGAGHCIDFHNAGPAFQAAQLAFATKVG